MHQIVLSQTVFPKDHDLHCWQTLHKITLSIVHRHHYFPEFLNICLCIFFSWKNDSELYRLINVYGPDAYDKLPTELDHLLLGILDWYGAWRRHFLSEVFPGEERCGRQSLADMDSALAPRF